jgi:chaperone BCS1
MLEHLARRNDSSSHRSINTTFKTMGDNSIGDIKYSYKPSPGRHIMWNDRWPMWIERHREKPTIGTNEPYESITIETFQLSKQDGNNRMESLLEKARSEAMLEIEENSTLEIFGTNGQDWYQITTQARRPLESVILNPGIREEIIDDMKIFTKSRDHYANLGIPFRRGYLFFGSPGSGKTSLINALASELKYSISLINMSDKLMDDSRFLHLMNKAPPNTIIVLEDIDCAFRDRRKEIENDPRYLGASGGVTNSGLLNAIDGVTNSDGRIVIMTTNYIDQLDAALIRPGRVDRRFEFEDASDLQICGVFLKFFQDASDVEAWNFLSAVRSFRNEENNGISMAELQGHLMLTAGNPMAAIQSCSNLANENTSEDLMKEISKTNSNHRLNIEDVLEPKFQG